MATRSGGRLPPKATSSSRDADGSPRVATSRSNHRGLKQGSDDEESSRFMDQDLQGMIEGEPYTYTTGTARKLGATGAGHGGDSYYLREV